MGKVKIMFKKLVSCAQIKHGMSKANSLRTRIKSCKDFFRRILISFPASQCHFVLREAEVCKVVVNINNNTKMWYPICS